MACPRRAGIVGTADADEAFTDADYAIFLGAFPRKEGMERKDVMSKNVGIFNAQGSALAKAKSTVRAVVVGDVAPACLGETIWNADHQAMSSVWRDGDEVGGYYESHMKLPPRAKYGSQAIGSARLAASHAAVNGQRAGREALPARAEAHDLEAKMMEACLPRRYFLKLVEMGFDSVEQLLYLGRLGRPLHALLHARAHVQLRLHPCRLAAL